MGSRIDSTVLTSRVRLGVGAPYLKSKLNLLNGRDTWLWITERRGLIGWTYSFDHEFLHHFKRLIVGISTRTFPQVKCAANVHQKVYIDKKEMLVSSANLVAPTIQNVSFIIRDPVYINHMTIQFNKQWRAL